MLLISEYPENYLCVLMMAGDRLLVGRAGFYFLMKVFPIVVG